MKYKYTFKDLEDASKIFFILKIIIIIVILAVQFYDSSGHNKKLWIGIEFIQSNETIKTQFETGGLDGVLINKVFENSPAESTGLMRGDIIVNVADNPVRNRDDFLQILDDKLHEKALMLVYIRNGTRFSTTISPDYKPEYLSAEKPRSSYSYSINLEDCFGFFILGIIAGTLSGTIGCGGGVIKVSALIFFFGFDIYLARVVTLISSGFMSLSASYRNLKHNKLNRDVLKYLIPSSIVGVIDGVMISVFLKRYVVELMLGIFLVYVMVDMVYQVITSRPDEKDEEAVCAPVKDNKTKVLISITGFPTGFFSGILGITGGVINTPLQRYFLKYPIKQCIANTVVTAIFVSFMGGLLLLGEGLINHRFTFRTFLIVLAIIPGSIIGGQVGSILNKVLPLNWVKLIYAGSILIVSFKIFF